MPAGEGAGELPDPCHLLLPPGVQPDAKRTAARIAPLLGVRTSDLIVPIRDGGGWLLRGLSAERAREVCEALELPLWAIPDDVPLTPPVELKVRAVRDCGTGRALRLALELGSGELDVVAVEEIAALFLAADGELLDEDEAERDAANEWSGDLGALHGISLGPFARQRRELLARGLCPEDVALYVVRAEPVEFFRLGIGVCFPERAARGDVSGVDGWLELVHDLLTTLRARTLPETVAFWDGEGAECITADRGELLARRKLWLAELIARDLWRPET